MSNTNPENSVFKTLNSVNCNEHVEKKGNLSYLSWAWAWQIVKAHFPQSFYTIYENPDGWNYFTDGRSCWVKTGVTIEGLEHIEYLPIMDARNQAIPIEGVQSTDVNRAIQRSLTKACARHGLGLYIYAGEDCPSTEPRPNPTSQPQYGQPPVYPQAPPPESPYPQQTRQSSSWRQSRSQYYAGNQQNQ